MPSFSFLLSWQAGVVSSSKKKKKSLIHFGNEVGLDPVSDLSWVPKDMAVLICGTLCMLQW